MEMFLRIIAGVLGIAVVAGTLLSAIGTVVLPRGTRSRTSTTVFRVVRTVLDIIGGRDDHVRRDRALALLTPVSMILILLVWLILETLGFGAIFWATGTPELGDAFVLAGSSLLTLGFAPTDGSLLQTSLVFLDATIGLALIALLIAYLPQMYAAFQRREQRVALLEVRAGSPPSSVEMLTRFHSIGYLGSLDELWVEWEMWFSDLDESHSSLSPLVFFRSQDPQRSWVAAAAVVLDTAALQVSAMGLRSPAPQLCIRAGYVALRNIADVLGIAHDASPSPGDPILLTRAEFDLACEELIAAGITIVDDRDQAWKDFAGWRVNYESVLMSLSELTVPPPGVRWLTD